MKKICNKHLFVIENFAFELKVPLSTHNLQYYPNGFCHLNNVLSLNREWFAFLSFFVSLFLKCSNHETRPLESVGKGDAMSLSTSVLYNSCANYAVFHAKNRRRSFQCGIGVNSCYQKQKWPIKWLAQIYQSFVSSFVLFVIIFSSAFCHSTDPRVSCRSDSAHVNCIFGKQ